MSQSQAEHLLSGSLESFETIYYRETEASALVAAGLAQITFSYPQMTFERQSGDIVASAAGKAVHSFSPASDKGAAEVWGDDLAVTFERLVAASPPGGPTMDELTDTFLKGIADSLDGAVAYGAPAKISAAREKLRGGNGRLNIDIKPSGTGWQIDCVRDATLREAESVLPGDHITHVAGTPTEGLSGHAVADLFAGPLGTSVDLTLVRESRQAPFTITLQRKKRGTDSVRLITSGAFPRTLIASFERETTDDLRDALRRHAALPGASKGMILDLRGNRGGLLESVIGTADDFLPAGRIISTQGRHKDSEQHFRAKSQTSDLAGPLVVLTDGLTGSGAEILVAALQDNVRAIIVGEPTFGLGTIRTILPLSNGGLLILPWTETVSTAGYRLDKRGVMPMVCTGGDVTADQILASLRNGTGGVTGKATRTRDIDPDDTAAIDAFRALCPPREDSADVSLAVAQALLADPALYAEVLAAAAR